MKSILSVLLALCVAIGLGACKGRKLKPLVTGKITAIVPADHQLWLDEGKRTRDYYWDGETKVLTPKGPGTIESVKAGDKVKLILKKVGDKIVATEIEVRDKKDKNEAQPN